MRIYRNRMLSMGMVRGDVIASKSALSGYKEQGFKELKGICAYHIQQACEKLIKLQIYSLASSVNNHKMYTHNLNYLVNYGHTLGIKLYIPIKSVEQERISTWESTGRYGLRFKIRVDVLEKYIRVIEDWYSVLYSKGFR